MKDQKPDELMEKKKKTLHLQVDLNDDTTFTAYIQGALHIRQRKYFYSFIYKWIHKSEVKPSNFLLNLKSTNLSSTTSL